MRLAGEFVVFHLSTEGLEALKGLVPESGSVPAFVFDEHELGVWIWMSAEKARPQTNEDSAAQELVPVILLKREYFSTATLDRDLKSLPRFPESDLALG